MNRVMRKPDFSICENKDADQISTFVLRHTDSTIPLLSKSEISSVQQSSVVVQPDLCRKPEGFLTTRLISAYASALSDRCLGWSLDR